MKLPALCMDAVANLEILVSHGASAGYNVTLLPSVAGLTLAGEVVRDLLSV